MILINNLKLIKKDGREFDRLKRFVHSSYNNGGQKILPKLFDAITINHPSYIFYKEEVQKVENAADNKVKKTTKRKAVAVKIEEGTSNEKILNRKEIYLEITKATFLNDNLCSACNTKLNDEGKEMLKKNFDKRKKEKLAESTDKVKSKQKTSEQTSFDENIWNSYTSQLNVIVEQFLIIEQLKTDHFVQQQLLAKAYKFRQSDLEPKVYERLLEHNERVDKAEKKAKEKADKDAKVAEEKAAKDAPNKIIETAVFDNKVSDKNKKTKDLKTESQETISTYKKKILEKLSVEQLGKVHRQSLNFIKSEKYFDDVIINNAQFFTDCDYLFKRLRLSLTFHGIKKMRQLDNDLVNIDELLNIVQMPVYHADVKIELYSKVLKLYLNNSNHDFENTVQDFEIKYDQLEKGQQNELFTHIQNYTIRNINTIGNFEYYKIAHKWFKLGITDKFIEVSKSSKLSETMFLNIANVASAAQDFLFCKKFIADYKDFIACENPKNTVELCNVNLKLNQYQKDKRSIKLIDIYNDFKLIKPTTFVLKLTCWILELKLYFYDIDIDIIEKKEKLKLKEIEKLTGHEKLEALDNLEKISHTKLNNKIKNFENNLEKLKGLDKQKKAEYLIFCEMLKKIKILEKKKLSKKDFLALKNDLIVEISTEKLLPNRFWLLQQIK